MVSIILPVYNGDAHLNQAINSVLMQSFSDWELIIINDGSTDITASIIQSYVSKDSRIRQIVHEENLGLVASLNEAIAVSSGNLLARIDCDDYWSSPAKLTRQVDFLESHPKCGLLGTWAEMLNAKGKHLYDFKPPTNNKEILGQMLWHNCFIHSSVLIRKNILQQAGGYKAEDRHVEDYALWLRMGLCADYANLQERMVGYRVNVAGITRTKNYEQIGSIINLIQQYKNKYPNYWLGWLKWRWQKLLSYF